MISKSKDIIMVKVYTAILVAVVCALGFLAGTTDSHAAVIKALPRINIKYLYHDNIFADDPDHIAGEDKSSATSMNYQAGLALIYSEGHSSFEVDGDAGYRQYLTMSGRAIDHGEDIEDYNFLTLAASVQYRYAGSAFILVLTDRARQSRNLGDVFGESTEAIGDWSLYLHNVASAQLTISPMRRTRLLLGYSYESLNFTEPESSVVQKPPDSPEQRGIVRLEHDITSKTTGVVDVQGANRIFEEIKDPATGATEKPANYNLLQGMVGIKHKVSTKTRIEIMGGYATRDFYDISDTRLPLSLYIAAQNRWVPYRNADLMYDLEDMGDPIGRAAFSTGIPHRYSFVLSGTKGFSTYGQNIFFSYTSGRATFDYFFTPKLSAGIEGSFNQAVYDREKNGREWTWDEDKIDDIYGAGAHLTYDILQKGGKGTLTLRAGYSYLNRDSSIDEWKDYADSRVDGYATWYQALYPAAPWSTVMANVHENPTLFRSYDAVVNTFYVQFIMLPTIVVGGK